MTTFEQNTERRVAVIDYGMGNLSSVARYASRAGASVRITSHADDINWAERIIIPGVGAFSDAMDGLRERALIEPLKDAVQVQGKPVLGICLGMELLCRMSAEGQSTNGLGWVEGTMEKFDRKSVRVPHVGWNQLKLTRSCPLFDGVEDGEFFYFVHSYHMNCEEASLTVATSDYGESFTAAIQKKNVFGTQFHPEKSQASGFKILRNFISKEL